MMTVSEVISNALIGAATLYVVGNVFYWIGRLVMGLSVHRWTVKDEGSEEWFAHMIVGFTAAAATGLVGSICYLVGSAILQTVGA
jgi:hypothetical protein